MSPVTTTPARWQLKHHQKPAATRHLLYLRAASRTMKGMLAPGPWAKISLQVIHKRWTQRPCKNSCPPNEAITLPARSQMWAKANNSTLPCFILFESVYVTKQTETVWTSQDVLLPTPRVTSKLNCPASIIQNWIKDDFEQVSRLENEIKGKGCLSKS